MQTNTNTSAQSLKDISTHPQINRVKPLVHRNWWLFFPLVLLTLFLTMAPSQAQPQAPITWSEPVQVLTINANIESTLHSVHAKGDTILVLTQRAVREGSHLVGRVSSNAGLTWTSPYYFYDSVLAHQSIIVNLFSAKISNTGTIYVMSPLNEMQSAIWRSTNAGQTWIRQFIPFQDIAHRLEDVIGDTLFCHFRTAPTSGMFVAYTTNGGANFTTIRNLLTTYDQVTVNSHTMHITSNALQLDTTLWIYPVYYTRGGLLSGPLEPPRVINAGATFFAQFETKIKNNGVGMIAVAGKVNPNSAQMDDIFKYHTFDNGANWSNVIRIIPGTHGGKPVPILNVEKKWLLTWRDTTVDRSLTPNAIRTLRHQFSANDQKSFYPVAQSLGMDSVPQIAWLQKENSIGSNLIVHSIYRTRLSGSTTYELNVVTGVITPDTLPPLIINSPILPTLIDAGTTLPLLFQGTDNDSLWRIQLIVKREESTDSLVSTFVWQSHQNYVLTWQAPADTGVYHYYYAAEDMWDNYTYFPSDTTNLTFRVQATSVKNDPLPTQPVFTVYPNPGNQSFHFTYSLPPMTFPPICAIYDIQGRLVEDAVFYPHDGSSVRKGFWHGKNRSGVPVPSGVYIAQLQTPTQVYTQKIVVMR